MINIAKNVKGELAEYPCVHTGERAALFFPVQNTQLVKLPVKIYIQYHIL